eukprot:10814-Eustigmatos_ZCMA.PRE.1
MSDSTTSSSALSSCMRTDFSVMRVLCEALCSDAWWGVPPGRRPPPVGGALAPPASLSSR